MAQNHTLLAGRDGYFDELEFDKAYGESATSSVMVPGLIRMPLNRMEGVGKLLQRNNWSPDILRIIQWSSRSMNARLGLEVASINAEEGQLFDSDSEWLFPVVAAFRPWEDRSGNPVENPLVAWLGKHFREMLIEAGRPYVIHPEAVPLSEDEIRVAMKADKIRAHPDARIHGDQMLLPTLATQFRLRPDLMFKSAIRDVFMGSGRGAIDAIQPPLHHWHERSLKPHSYGITATKFSFTQGLAGVLQKEMVDLDGKPSNARHGSSQLWDGGKTTGTGPQHMRHLEVINPGHTDLPLKTQAVGVKIYRTLPTNGEADVVQRLIRAYPESVHSTGLSLDHFASLPAHATAIRTALNRVCDDKNLWGLYVSPLGVTSVPTEEFEQEQTMAVMRASERSTQQDREPFTHWPELLELSQLLTQMGDPRQRAVLFAREAPTYNAMHHMMQRGVRGLLTPNVSRAADHSVYLTVEQLQQYKDLTRQGLDLYLVRPQSIRRLWNDLFVRLDALERVQRTDFRIGGFASSANGSEEIMKKGNLRAFLEQCLHDYPNASLVTGAAKAGGMQYLNEEAKAVGMTTLGIANFIPGQEEAGDDLDALTSFHRFGFNNRQDLMSTLVSFPVASIGAEGTGFEESLERVHRKIAMGPMSPIAYVDPEGLDEGKNMWATTIQRLQKIYATPVTPEESPGFTLSRAPYMSRLLTFSPSYLNAYKSAAPFFADPVGYLRNAGASDAVIGNAIASMQHDAQSNGLPIHAFWQKPMEDWLAPQKR